MKVLFAVNNDEISDAIIKKYQKQYKEILSYKNVYYFNAIIRELQKDKSYDRVVISEDLEPFINNNYENNDKFLFDKLDNISDEATDAQGNNTDIVLICNDRRSKSDDVLVKYFGIGIYSALIGQDRKIDEVCKLINKPRNKRDAKQYYKIEAESVNYQSEDENNVSEAEVQNILNHYRRLGKNEEKYLDSFNNIVSQYNDNQLRIIISYLPIWVKAVLEEKSPKYQELMINAKTYNNIPSQSITNTPAYKKSSEVKKGINVKMLEKDKKQITKPIVVPTGVNKQGVKKLIKDSPRTIPIQKSIVEPQKLEENNIIKETNKVDNKLPDLDALLEQIDDIENSNVIEQNNEFKQEMVEQNNIVTTKEKEDIVTDQVEPVKRGRGRPKKIVPVNIEQENKPKRGRGRPRKTPLTESVTDEETEIETLDLTQLENETENSNNIEKTENIKNDELDLFGLNSVEEDDELDLFELNNTEDDNIDLSNGIFNQGNNNLEEKSEEDEFDIFGLDAENEEENIETFDSNAENEEEGIDLFGFGDNQETNTTIIEPNDSNDDFDLSDLNNDEVEDNTVAFNTGIMDSQQNNINSNFTSLLSKDKKVITFVGTTKNGTSFVVNNLAELFASMGIKTAVLDLTKSKNAFYIYTNNEEKLRNVAQESINKLKSGIAEGLTPNKNLGIYTSLPTENIDFSDADSILSTLIKNYSVVLVDCDFETPIQYFEKSQEIFLVQSMDVLTIQPLTAFLRNLKAKEILKQDKIKIVINKFQKIRNLSAKTLIGGIAFYNDPGMSYMTELFNKDIVPYCVIPFEMQNYAKYLEALAMCSMNLNGYTKTFISSLKDLANLAYPLMGKQTYYPMGEKYRDNFSEDMNNTLNKMKKYQ